MPRVLGKASYTATRVSGMLRLTAFGQTPNFGDRVDFGKLPFLTIPPMYAFFFVLKESGLPAVSPFVYSEDFFSYPKSAKSVRIQDADGIHDVAISDIAPPVIDAIQVRIADDAPGYCVFSLASLVKPSTVPSFMIAECHAVAVLPDIVPQVFGPATFGECGRFIAEHGGGTT
jgi:hypothetical protein